MLDIFHRIDLLAPKFGFMVKYNPKTWFNLIFHSYSRHVLKTLLPALGFMTAFTAVVCFVVLGIFHLKPSEFHSTTVVHSLLGIVLGLFLVFRTNSAYDRWWEGRRLWGGLVNSTRNFAIKLHAYISPEDHETRSWFAGMIANYVFATKEHLRKGVQFDEIDSVEEGFKDKLKTYTHRPNRLSAMMYEKVNALYKQNTLTGDQLINLDKELKDFIDIMGACERIRN